jgi:hypothetical protein
MHRNWLTRLLASAALLGGLFVGALGASAQGAPLGSSVWLPGPDSAGTAESFSSAIDGPAPGKPSQFSGWIVDTSAQGWSGIDDVQVWNGPMDAGGRLLAHPVFQQDRPDVAAALNNPYWAACGFSADLGVGVSIVYLYAHTPGKGWWYQQVFTPQASARAQSRPTLNIETPTSLATVHSNAAYRVSGYAFDPNARADQGVGIDRVQVYLNGDRASGIYVGDATLGNFDKFASARGTQFANAGWQMSFQPNSWMDTPTDNHLVPLTVYARSSVTGLETQMQTTIVITVP